MKKVTDEQKKERKVSFWNICTASERKSILEKMLVIVEAGYNVENVLGGFIQMIQKRKGERK